MKSEPKRFLMLLTGVALMSTIGFAQDQGQTLVICDQPYALCTSAPCIPDPEDPQNQAICSCAVQQGPSLGSTSCAARAMKTISVAFAPQATTQLNQPEPVLSTTTTQILASTFSFNQLLGSPESPPQKILFCPSGSPWTFCLDAPCTVDPQNPDQAICRCAIKWEGRFLTLGGGCDPKTCQTAYWSGATVQDMDQASATLNSILTQPVQWRDHICSGQKP